MVDEKRKTKSEKRKNRIFSFSIFVFRFSFILSLAVMAGCSTNHPTTRPATAAERQNAALKDPFGYSPDIDSTSISGGGIGEYDRNAMRKDINNVLNP
jgi:hypothetical protein